MLIEVKTIGLEPKDAHAKQAVECYANEGIEWVAKAAGKMLRIRKDKDDGDDDAKTTSPVVPAPPPT
ncbi:MAG TPA: hypothetical protein VF787_20770 [Thermoanaerobaculia bacterium]